MATDTKIILIADDDLDDQELLEETILELNDTASVHTVLSGKDVI